MASHSRAMTSELRMGPHRLRSWSVFFLLAAAVAPAARTWAGPIAVGSISSEPADEIRKFQPLATYLAGKLQAEGITQGMVVVANSMPQMAALLREGKADLYIDSPFPALAVSRLSGSKLLLRRWKKGIGEYHSVIFGRADGGIRHLEDLKGKMIAFEEAFSTTGYFLPKVVLRGRGLRVVAKADASDRVGPGEVGYVFSQDDETTMVWVLRGRVSAGAMDQQNYLKTAKQNVDRLTILHRTFALPRQIVSHRADLPPRLVARVREILVAMDQSDEGRKALHDFEQTTKFDTLPDQALAPLQKLQPLIDAEFGLQ